MKTTQISKLLRKMQKFAHKKVIGKKSMPNGVCPLFLLLTCKRFWQITFCGCTFSIYFHGFEISVKFCVFLILLIKKEIKNVCVIEHIYVWVFFGTNRMQIHKNDLTSWKISFTNISKNIIWRRFAGESHQVVKITETYPSHPIYLIYVEAGGLT
jgi:hypothetical protein